MGLGWMPAEPSSSADASADGRHATASPSSGWRDVEPDGRLLCADIIGRPCAHLARRVQWFRLRTLRLARPPERTYERRRTTSQILPGWLGNPKCLGYEHRASVIFTQTGFLPCRVHRQQDQPSRCLGLVVGVDHQVI